MAEEISIIAIATAIMTAIGLIISQFYNHKQLINQNNAKYLELIQGFSEKLSDLLKEGDALSYDPKKNYECITWTYRYLEPLDMMAYIKQNQHLPPQITDYFHVGWFGLGKSLMVWYDESVCSKKPNLRKSSVAWPFLSVYCEKNNIEEIGRSEFPKALEKQYPSIKSNSPIV